MTEMTMKEALELAIDSIEYVAAEYREMEDEESAERYTKAAAMLRDGGPMVEKSELCNMIVCDECGKPIIVCKHSRYGNQYVRKEFMRKWTEREKIKIVVEKSKSTFEEIK